MKKFTLLLILALGIYNSISAAERTLQEMQAIAAKVLANSMSAKSVKGSISATPLTVIRTNSELTVLGNKGQGFAVIANDDNVNAVLAYSDDYDGTIAPGAEWYIETMNQSLKEMEEKGITPINSVKKAPTVSASVPEMLTCRWDQGAPFNNMTPLYTSNGTTSRYVTGCVATAMSQILYYHKDLERGVGSASYRFTPIGGSSERIASTFSDHAYDWASMIDVYSSGAYTQAQADAVAQIMFDCGVSVSMQYSIDGSGAYTSDACLALRNNFARDPNIKMFCRDYYPVEEWMNIIFEEINSGYPILYGGASTSRGGHEFVFDGYDEAGLVHVNWGWGGQSNGYFDIANLQGFNTQQEMVQVREPQGLSYYSIWGLSSNLACQKKNATSFGVSTSGTIFNLDVERFTGSMAIIISSTANPNNQYIVNQQSISGTPAYGEGGYITGINYADQTVNITTLGLPDGEYRVYLATKATNEASWRTVRSKENIANSAIMTVTDGKLTMRTDPSSNWTDIKSVNTESNGVVNVYDLSGRLIYSGVSAGFTPTTKGTFIVKNGNNATKVAIY